MAIHRLNELRISHRLINMARAIASKDRILKNRSDQLQALLGRIKEHLGEDEVLIIAKQDAFMRPEDKKDIKMIIDGQEMGTIQGLTYHATPLGYPGTGATGTFANRYFYGNHTFIDEPRGFNAAHEVAYTPMEYVREFQEAVVNIRDNPDPWRPIAQVQQTEEQQNE